MGGFSSTRGYLLNIGFAVVIFVLCFHLFIVVQLSLMNNLAGVAKKVKKTLEDVIFWEEAAGYGNHELGI